jgi:hypothetical protein
MVLLMRAPFAQTKELYAEAAARSFGVPYDGTSEMHCVEQAPDFFLMKVGEFLVAIRPKWGAYLAKHGETDVESGAASSLRKSDDGGDNSEHGCPSTYSTKTFQSMKPFKYWRRCSSRWLTIDPAAYGCRGAASFCPTMATQ